VARFSERRQPPAEKIANSTAALEVTTEFLLTGSTATPDEEALDEAFFGKYEPCRSRARRSFARSSKPGAMNDGWEKAQVKRQEQQLHQ